jgi:hypothetical protein
VLGKASTYASNHQAETSWQVVEHLGASESASQN